MDCRSFYSTIRLVVTLSLLFQTSGQLWGTSYSDVSALLAVKRSFSGVENGRKLREWTGDPCSDNWPGIFCNYGGCPFTVIAMDLSNLGLTGQIVSEIGNFDELQYLSFSNNNISGFIPPSIGQLRGLRYLHLDNNQLTGSIPSEIGGLIGLKELRLSNNNLFGQLPKNVDSLPNLELLDIRKTNIHRRKDPSILEGIQKALFGSHYTELHSGDDESDETFLFRIEDLTGKADSGSRKERILQARIPPSTAPTVPPPETSPSSPPAIVPATPPTPFLPPPTSNPVPSPQSSAPPQIVVPAPVPLVSPSLPSPIPSVTTPSTPPVTAPVVPISPPTLPPVSPPSLPPPVTPPVVAPSFPPPPLVAPTSPPDSTSGPVSSPTIPPAVPPAMPPSSSPVTTPGTPPVMSPINPPVSPVTPPVLAPAIPPVNSPLAPEPSSSPIPGVTEFPPPKRRPPPPRKREPPPPKKRPPPPKKRSPPPKKSSPPPVSAPEFQPPVSAPTPTLLPAPAPAPTSAPTPAPSLAPTPLATPTRRPPPALPSPPSCPICAGDGKLARPNNCDCVFPLFAWFYIDMNFNVFKTQKAEEFRSQLAASLPFPAENILFINMVSGSVYLNIAMLPSSPDISLNDTIVSSALEVLQGTNNKKLLFSSDFVNVTVLNTTSPTIVPITARAPPPPKKSSGGLSTVVIIAIAAGGALIVAIILILLWCCCCRRKHPKAVPDAPKDYTPPKPALRPTGGWANGEPMDGPDFDGSPGAGRVREIESGRDKDTNSPLISKREARDAPAAATLTSGPSPTSSNVATAGGEAGVVATAAAVASLNRMESRKVKKDEGGVNGLQKKAAPILGAQAFTVADLQVATNSFSLENKIGEGPMGSIYRADFAQGRALAIRKMDPAVVEGMSDEDFKAVVNNMARLRNPNIVELHGYCVQYGQRLLAFQYFSVGSVYDYLHDPQRQRQADLTWDVRLRLAIGCARALEYIHEQVTPPVMHRNFKSSNILLDKELQPHVADCGMAVFNPIGVENMVQGGLTYGAPEYMMSGVYTVMSDVYSFGVLLLELLTGREPIDMSRAKPEQSLVRWAAPLLHDLDELEGMTDPKLPGPQPDKNSLTRFAEVITRCIQHEPELRPPMSKVVQDLIRRVAKSPKSNGLDRSPSGVPNGDRSFRQT